MPFINIPISFTSLIPYLIPPTDDRENSDLTPRDQKVRFVKIQSESPFVFSDMIGDFFVIYLAYIIKI